MMLKDCYISRDFCLSTCVLPSAFSSPSPVEYFDFQWKSGHKWLPEAQRQIHLTAGCRRMRLCGAWWLTYPRNRAPFVAILLLCIPLSPINSYPSCYSREPQPDAEPSRLVRKPARSRIDVKICCSELWTPNSGVFSGASTHPVVEIRLQVRPRQIYHSVTMLL